jgi:hypothetical protein
LEGAETEEGFAALLLLLLEPRGLPPIFNDTAGLDGADTGTDFTTEEEVVVPEEVGFEAGEEGTSPVTLAISSEGALVTLLTVLETAAWIPSTVFVTELLKAVAVRPGIAAISSAVAWAFFLAASAVRPGRAFASSTLRLRLALIEFKIRPGVLLISSTFFCTPRLIPFTAPETAPVMTPVTPLTSPRVRPPKVLRAATPAKLSARDTMYDTNPNTAAPDAAVKDASSPAAWLSSTFPTMNPVAAPPTAVAISSFRRSPSKD